MGVARNNIFCGRDQCALSVCDERVSDSDRVRVAGHMCVIRAESADTSIAGAAAPGSSCGLATSQASLIVRGYWWRS